MATREFRNNVRLDKSITGAVYNSDTNGTGIDLQGFESALVIVEVGTSADTLNTTNTIALELEESDDDSTYTDVADADMVGENGAASSGQWHIINGSGDDDKVYTVAYVGAKRYIRPVLNFSGTHSTGTDVSASVLKGHPHKKPTSPETANST